jgi:hypothetical protein
MLSAVGRTYTADSANLEARANLGGEAALSSAEDDVEELFRVGHWSNVLPRSLHLEFLGRGTREVVEVVVVVTAALPFPMEFFLTKKSRSEILAQSARTSRRHSNFCPSSNKFPVEPKSFNNTPPIQLPHYYMFISSGSSK